VLKGVVEYSPGFEVAAAMLAGDASSSLANLKKTGVRVRVGFSCMQECKLVRENHISAAISLQTTYSTRSELTGMNC
jgi:hydrogenase maturation factor